MKTPENPRLIRPRGREFDSNREYESQQFDLANSDLTLNITHRPDGDTTILLARDGDGVQAGIIADEDDNLRVKTQD